MIKPTSLWNFIHECELADAEYIGRICLALAKKPNIPMSRSERIQFKAIAKDNADMDERIELRREKTRKRVAESRTRTNADVTPCNALHGVTSECNALPDTIHPSIRSSIHPSVQNNKTDPIPNPIACARKKSASSSDSAKKIVGTVKAPDPWSMPDDDIRYGNDLGTVALLNLALGKGGWAKAVAQVGDQAARELFITIRNEMRVGESAEHPAAVYTARCKRELGVDFSLSLAESEKVGKAAGVR